MDIYKGDVKMRKHFKPLIVAAVFTLAASYSYVVSAKDLYLNEDLNKDGYVDINDVALICKKYNENYEAYDLNKDSIIDIYDIAKLAQKYNQTSFGRGIVNTEELNLRSGPSTNTDILYTFKTIEEFTIVDDLGEWYKIKFNINNTTIEGYVYALYTLPIEDNYFNSFSGFLSSRFESTTYVETPTGMAPYKVRDAGLITTNDGDEGGKSYGLYQLASSVGGVDNFLNWLKATPNATSYFTTLQNAKVMDGNNFGANFDAAWENLATSNYNEFFNLQRIFVKNYYYDYAADILEKDYNFDLETKSFALREVLWSTAVQYGRGKGDGIKTLGAIDIFLKAGLENSEEVLINKIYDIKIAHAESRNDFISKARANDEKGLALKIYHMY